MWLSVGFQSQKPLADWMATLHENAEELVR
jgi:hypothetical protein